MKIELLNAAQVGKKLNELIASEDKFYCAVAWARENAFSKKLAENENKIQKIIIGIDYAQTDYQVLEKFENLESVRYMPQNGSKTFHPKIYYFENDNEVVAIVGSSNLTYGGIQKNDEASLLIQGEKENDIFKQIFKQIDDWFSRGLPISSEFLDGYKNIVDKNKEKRREFNDEVSNELATLNHPITTLISNETVENHQDEHFNLDEIIKAINLAVSATTQKNFDAAIRNSRFTVEIIKLFNWLKTDQSLTIVDFAAKNQKCFLETLKILACIVNKNLSLPGFGKDLARSLKKLQNENSVSVKDFKNMIRERSDPKEPYSVLGQTVKSFLLFEFIELVDKKDNAKYSDDLRSTALIRVGKNANLLVNLLNNF